jgi:hypothetical protein
MGQYLERYLGGEYQAVWNELLVQGAAIRTEPFASEAWAVAQETMRRVRHNIEYLIPRLRMLGYRFGEIPHDPAWERWERDFVQAYPIFQPPPPDTTRLLDELEQRVGVLPLSLRAFYLEIGGVNFIGVDPWITTGIYYDPLFVEPLATLPEWPVEEEEDLEPGPEGATDLILSPDAVTKYNSSGSDPYLMTVPNPGIDGVFDIYKKTTFVEYLRNSLRSGGLVDLERTEYIGDAANTLAALGRPIPAPTIIEHAVKEVKEALAYLQQDLLPI